MNKSEAEAVNCELCGEPMPLGEEMFNYHGYSGPCPKPPLAKPTERERFEKWWKDNTRRTFRLTKEDGWLIWLGAKGLSR